jgi:hypothetical protein
MTTPKARPQPVNALPPENVKWQDGSTGLALPPSDVKWQDGTTGHAPPTAVAPAASAPVVDAPPQIGSAETFINRATNAIPAGKPIVDAFTAAELQASRFAGSMLPRALARRLPGVIPEQDARLTPQAKAELTALGEPVERGAPHDFVDTYRDVRDTRAARTELGSEQNPWAGRAGTATGMLLSAGLPLPAVKAGGEAAAGVPAAVAAAARPTLLKRALAGAATGAGYGALGGITDGPADLTRGDVAGAARDAALGGTFGALMGGTMPAVTTPGNLWRSMPAGAVLGAGVGTIAGLADSQTKGGAGDVLASAGKGALAGSMLPLALGLGQRIYRGVVKPTEAAQYLRGKGVKLTTGQMNPDSKLAQMEEASSAAGGAGVVVKRQREASRSSWQDAVLNESRPPGAAPLDPKKDIASRLDENYQGFFDAYQPAHNHQVELKTSDGRQLFAMEDSSISPTAARAAVTRAGVAPLAGDTPVPRDAKGRFLPRAQEYVERQKRNFDLDTPSNAPKDAFTDAVKDRMVLATSEDRAVVKDFLNEVSTILSTHIKGGRASSTPLLMLRNLVRAKHGEKLVAQEFAQAQLLENAEREITSVLDAGLPAPALRALREADSQYSKFKPVVAAVAKSGDAPEGFTPYHLSQGARRGLEEGAYARGAGGEMRKMAATGRSVLDARVQTNGLMRVAEVPVIGAWGTAPVSAIANYSPVQRFLLGETYPQLAGQGVDRFLSRYIQRNPTEAEAGALMPPSDDVKKRMHLEKQRAQAEALRRRE